MNIKQFAEKAGLDETVPSILFTFPECSAVVLGGLAGQLGEFGTYLYLTTVKEYRKKLNLKGFASVDVNAIKEISELEYDKFLEVYGASLQPRLEDKTNDFWKGFNRKKKASYARAKPTAAGGTANDDRLPGNYQYWVQDEHGNWSRGKSDFDADNENAFPLISKRTPGETRDMEPEQFANFRNIVDLIVSDIQLFYQEFLDDPSEPVMSQKNLSNFADKEDRVRLIIAVAKPLPFALVNKETDTLEVTTCVPELNTSRIKLGALKLLCLETIATLSRKLGLEEHPNAVVDGFNLSSIRFSDRIIEIYQVASLQWYISVSKEVAIYFQVEVIVPSPDPSPFFDNAVFRQAPKYKK